MASPGAVSSRRRGWGGVVLLFCVAGGVASCASEPAPLPLRPEPVPYADTLPIPEPREREEPRVRRAAMVHTPYLLSEPFRVPEGEALNLTHDDDVVDSAWFVRRMGYRDLTPEEVAAGPTTPEGAPAASGPLIVTAGKDEGATPGFTVEDAKGDAYIVKLDMAGLDHLSTAPGVIVNRLMWAAGYHVPEDFLMVFDPARIELGGDAEIDTPGGSRAMTEDDIQRVLERSASLPDGRFVALASRFVPGIPKGPFFFAGTREDDPNDHYLHEYRRELRGLRTVSAWLNNTDLREGNTLDVYVEPGYLRHYVIDFGASLGSNTRRSKHPKDFAESSADPLALLRRIASLGLWTAGWEEEEAEALHPALGLLPAEDFEPGEWTLQWESPASLAATPADGYWGARIVASFTDAHIGAAVREGGLPEPWLEDTLTAVLSVRRDRLVEHWYGRVTPVEEPAVVEQEEGRLELAFRDLGLSRGIWSAGTSGYRWTFEHDARGIEASGRAPARPGERQTVGITWAGARTGEPLEEEDALATLTLLVERSGAPPADPRPATVWLRWAGSRYEVAGLLH